MKLRTKYFLRWFCVFISESEIIQITVNLLTTLDNIIKISFRLESGYGVYYILLGRGRTVRKMYGRCGDLFNQTHGFA